MHTELRCSSILLVDDREDELSLLSEILRMEGFQVRTAASGAETLLMLAQKNSDAVVTDLEMPGMDGWKLARRIRIAYGPAVLLIALSGTLPRGATASSLGSDFDFGFGKPVDPDALSAAIRVGHP